MKKIISLSLIAVLFVSVIFCLPVAAVDNTKTTTTIEYLENGDYIETIITEYESNARVATKSGSKTKNYTNSAGAVMWSVTVHGTFTYNGSTSQCTSAGHSTTAPGSMWSIKSASSRRSGYSAIADATATYTTSSSSKDYSMSVSLYCNPYGTLY